MPLRVRARQFWREELRLLLILALMLFSTRSSLAVSGYPAVPVPRTVAPIVVPPGEYFMMGDNRDDSFVSRFWGTVKREKVVGRATSVVRSFDKSNYWLPR